MNLFNFTYSTICIILLTSSCYTSSPTFYQLYKTESKEAAIETNQITFENEDLLIAYNLWADNGNGNFFIKNKTTQNISLDMSKSHLIINGIAHTYFQNRIFTSSSSAYSSISVGRTSSLGWVAASKNTAIGTVTTGTSTSNNSVSNSESVSYQEQQTISIPPNAGKVISGFKLKDVIYRSCDLYRFPKKKKITPIAFNEDNSPLTLQNYITYYLDDQNNSSKVVTNSFWVSEITNYPSESFYESKPVEVCDEVSISYTTSSYYKKPSNFYIKYEKESASEFKH